MKRTLLAIVVTLVAFVSNVSAQTTFNFTSTMDSIQVPNCTDSVFVEMWGAQGADAVLGGTGGLGGYVTGTIAVTPGTWIYVTVGGQGGFNGGGAGGINGFIAPSTVHGGTGGVGGGASDIRIGGTTLNDRMMVGGGGGGGAHNGVWPNCLPGSPAGNGGDGGGTAGTGGSSTFCNCTGGGGDPGMEGTQVAGGNGGGYNGMGCPGGGPYIGGNGMLGLGGVGNVNYWNGTGGGGGGGGGYYGGGAGGSGGDTTPGGGGGGGSNYTGSASNPTTSNGIRQGDGLIVLTFNTSGQATSSSQNDSICMGDSLLVGGGYQTTAGVYNDTLVNSQGCDSIVMTTLSIMTVTATATASNDTLMANAGAATYQWLTCDTTGGYTAIGGATNQTYVSGANGSFAVATTNSSGCADTSACVQVTGVGMNKHSLAAQIRLFPNPAKDQLNVFTGTADQVTFVITNSIGQVVWSGKPATSSQHMVDVSAFAPGVYWLKATSDTETTTIRFVKK